MQAVVIYVETSALLRVLLCESEYEALASTIESAPRCVTSALTVVEAYRALRRLSADQHISEAVSLDLAALIEQCRTAWDVMEITREVQDRAGRSFPVEPIRALDAIHLATALEFVRSGVAPQVLSCDVRVTDNVHPLGLQLAEEF